MNILKNFAAAGLAVAVIVTPVAAQERISIGTGGTGGLFYVIGAGIAELLNKHMPNTTARAEVTGASVENIRRVAAGQMTFGLSSSSTLFEASKGEGPFDEALPVAGMANLYPAVLQIAALKSSGIQSFEDLAGKRINMGPPGSNSAVLAQRLLEAYEVFDAGNVQFLSYNEGTAALINGTIDAAVVLAGAPTAALIDLGAQKEMQLLSADPEKLESLVAEYPFYQPYEIAAGTYQGQTEPVQAINDPATLFTVQSASDEMIGGIMTAIFEHLDELSQVHPQAKAISLATAPETPVPLHPAAQQYFDGKK